MEYKYGYFNEDGSEFIITNAFSSISAYSGRRKGIVVRTQIRGRFSFLGDINRRTIPMSESALDKSSHISYNVIIN